MSSSVNYRCWRASKVSNGLRKALHKY